MEYALLAALIVISLAGVILTALQLPGTWFVLLAAIGYDWYFDWQRFGWKWLLVLTAAAVAAEIFELLASSFMVKKAGASRRASWGALIGGFAGMILLSIPVPVLGTILGGLAGCFVGALIGEMTVRDDLTVGAKVGLFAAIGRLLGLILKLSAAMAVAGAAVAKAILAL